MFVEVELGIDWNQFITNFFSFLSGAICPLIFQWYKERKNAQLIEDNITIQTLKEIVDSLEKKYFKSLEAHTLLDSNYFELKEQCIILKGKEFIWTEKEKNYINEIENLKRSKL